MLKTSQNQLICLIHLFSICYPLECHASLKHHILVFMVLIIHSCEYEVSISLTINELFLIEGFFPFLSGSIVLVAWFNSQDTKLFPF
jgi:hypothetical protein